MALSHNLIRIIGIFFLMFALKYYMNGRTPGSNWRPAPSERYADVLREFGQPTVKDLRKNGMAVWVNPRNTPFCLVEIRDQEIPHSCPAPHVDFLTAGVRVDIQDPAALIAVLSISKSVWYDQLSRTLYARCHFMGANVATLALATRFLVMHMQGSLQAAYRDPAAVQAAYKSMVMASQNPTSYATLTQELWGNLAALPFGHQTEVCANTLDYNHMRNAQL